MIQYILFTEAVKPLDVTFVKPKKVKVSPDPRSVQRSTSLPVIHVGYYNFIRVTIPPNVSVFLIVCVKWLTALALHNKTENV